MISVDKCTVTVFLFLVSDFESSSNVGVMSGISPAQSEALERRAAAAERRVAHLASLLSESENENTRLAQMSELLKEEIRSE